MRRWKEITKIKDIMTTDFVRLQPDDTIEKAIRSFRTTRLEGLPVLDKNGTLLGIFTKTNLYDALLLGTGLADSIEPYFNLRVAKISENVSYEEFITIIKSSPVGLGVVVDDYDRTVGMITKVDLILAVVRKGEMLNAELCAIYNAMQSGVVSFNEQGIITFVNRAIKKIFSVREKDIVNTPLALQFPGLNVEKLLAGGETINSKKYEYREKTVIVNATPIIEEDGIAGGVAVFQDITELESVAMELEGTKRLNKTMETILEMAYDGIVVVDEHGRVILVNHAFLDFFGLSHGQLMGKKLENIIENSRLHIVAKTGATEINDVQFIKGKPYVVSRLPIVRDGRIIGAIGKIVFSRVEEVQEIARKLDAMASKLSFYKKELSKYSKNAPDMVSFDDIVTINSEFIKTKQEAYRVSQSNSTILLTGESGTGKELFAQAIHLASQRRKGPFIKVNCAAVPENLLESEFFGYMPGAFTGAHREGKPGKFELADGGTIFLDEIGDMPLSLQAKILRVLQDRAVERLGATKSKKVDVRVIAATNQNLEKKLREGSFREDLYYRLNVISLELPPLRERKEDIIPLSYVFLQKYNQLFGLNIKELSPQAMFVLQNYDWPGNVRELENVIERAVNFASHDVIEERHLPAKLFPGQEQPDKQHSDGDKGTSVNADIFEKKVNEAEYEIILSALRAAGGNKSKAAALLGKSRSWLYERLKKMDIWL